LSIDKHKNSYVIGPNRLDLSDVQKLLGVNLGW